MMQQLDARNLLCPMPVIKVQNKVKQLTKGDVIEVLATDPGTKQDIPAWCNIYGHQLKRLDELDSHISFFIEVGASCA